MAGALNAICNQFIHKCWKWAATRRLLMWPFDSGFLYSFTRFLLSNRFICRRGSALAMAQIPQLFWITRLQACNQFELKSNVKRKKKNATKKCSESVRDGDLEIQNLLVVFNFTQPTSKWNREKKTNTKKKLCLQVIVTIIQSSFYIA